MDVGGELVGNLFLFKTETEKLSIIDMHCDLFGTALVLSVLVSDSE